MMEAEEGLTHGEQYSMCYSVDFALWMLGVMLTLLYYYMLRLTQAHTHHAQTTASPIMFHLLLSAL